MEMTYQRICTKLGFDPENYEPEVSDFEDDSKVNPFSVLTIEESEFLYEYMMKHKNLIN